MRKVTFGRYVVETSNEDKVFFPDDALTKGDLVEYYREVSATMLPHLRGRPLMMHRFPNGIRKRGFYQKDAPDYFPDWIRRVEVSKEGGVVTHAICDKTATLVYLADQGCVTPHIWLSRADRLDHPDLMAFDLDPSRDDFALVQNAALGLRELLEELGLVPYVQTTGSRGLHVVVPLDRTATFDAVRSFAQDTADVLAARDARTLTTEQRKEKRGTRVYIDTFRNAYAQTIVAPYAVRARPGAPVATPLDWREVGAHDLTPTTYALCNVRRRLAQKDDPWLGMLRHARSLKGPAERLKSLRRAVD